MRRLIPTLALLLLAGCASGSRSSEPVHVVVAATTDFHGYFEGRTSRRGETTVTTGGLAQLAGYVDALRAEHGERLILIDGGDMWQGTLASNLNEGEVVTKAFSAMGYNATAIGNHEFDFGPVGELGAPATAADDPVGALRRNGGLASFPLLCTNILERSTGLTPEWCSHSLLVDTAGVKVGILGVTTEDTPSLTQPKNVAHLVFKDAAGAIVEGARDLRQRGADVVVVAAHIGNICTSTSDPERADQQCNADAPLVRLAQALPRGTVSLIAGGHTHNVSRHYVNGIALIQAPNHGQALAVADLWVNPASGRVVRSSLRPHTSICARVAESGECAPAGTGTIPVMEGREVVPSPSVAALIEPAIRHAQSRQQEPLGVRFAATMEPSYGSESALANLVTRAMRAAVPEADVAMINSGALRAPLEEGDLLFGDVYRTFPFDNGLIVLDITGEQLIGMVQQAMQREPYGIMHLDGVRVSVRYDGNTPQEISIVGSDGRPIDPARTYRVVTVDFLAAGGDGFSEWVSSIPASRMQLTGELLRDVMIRDLQQRSAHGPIRPVTTGWLTSK